MPDFENHFFYGEAVFGNQELLAGEIGCGNSNYYFFIPSALPHSDNISIVSEMLGMITIQAPEDTGQVHTANELQDI